jgi:hypothetical protein
LMDEFLAIFGHALDQCRRKEAWRFAESERNVHAAARGQFTAQAIVFVCTEVCVERVSVEGQHENAYWFRRLADLSG